MYDYNAAVELIELVRTLGGVGIVAALVVFYIAYRMS